VIAVARTRMRTAGPDDYPVLRALADAWFPAETLIEPALYRHLLGVGAVRVRILMCADGPAGYYALWPLTAAAYSSLRRGERRERDLTAIDIVAPQDERASVLYVSDVCRAPGASGGALRRPPVLILLRDLQRSLVALLRVHPHITRVAAWAFSSDGSRLAVRFGLSPVAPGSALVEIAAAAIGARLAPRERAPRRRR
jgi:hypothetical protein